MVLGPLLRKLHGLVEAPGNASLTELASTLDLDMSASTVTQTRAGDFVQSGARRQTFPLTPGVVVSATGPKRMIFLVLEGSDRIGYTGDLMAGLSAWIEQSMRADGFSCVASLGERGNWLHSVVGGSAT